MTDQVPERAPNLRPRRMLFLALISAAIALAITFAISNFTAPAASECPPQVDKAGLIDAAAVGTLAALNGTGQGRSYADMKFTDAAGKPMSVADFAGKKLLINFWASWCIPCRAEMPALDAIGAQYNSRFFQVLPINTGETQTDKAREFLAQGNWPNLPLYIDPNFAVIERLKTNAVSVGLPASVLVDEKGCELAVLQGPAEWDSADGRRVVEALIGT